MRLPGISCIMPTTESRLWCSPVAVEWWLRQTYQGPLELLIVSEDDVVSRTLCPLNTRLRSVPVAPGTTVGEKYNQGVLRAKYHWVALWADDDWYAPRRLARTMELANAYDAEMIGTASLLFHELIEPRRNFLYSWTGADWIAGTTLLFKRSVFAKVGFEPRATGSDTLFVRNAIRSGIKFERFLDPRLAVAMVHGQTTGRKIWDPSPPEYQPWPEDIYGILGPDLKRYETAISTRGY